MSLSIFEFHTGYEADEVSNQKVMDCPFCSKEKKFYFDPDSNQYDCKVCHVNGNQYTFIRKLYDHFDTLTVASRMVAEMREIPVANVSKFRVKLNLLNNTLIIPTWRNGQINNLYKVDKVKEKQKDGTWKTVNKVLCSPGIDHTLMNWDEDYPQELWVTEGHWDRIASDVIIGGQSIGIVGVPGSGVWKPAWCEVLHERDVVFMYDNDKPGQSGFQQVIIKHIASSQYKPKSISYVNWPQLFNEDGTPNAGGLKEGYDLNNLYCDVGRTSINKLREWITPYKSPDSIVVTKSAPDTIPADKSCDTFEKLMERFESIYHTTDSIRQGLLLVLSSIFSVRLEGEQLWIRLIGPPSSGKTTIAKCVSGSEQVVLMSTFTGLFSGWRDDSDKGGKDGKTKDASLIPMIKGKTLIVKEADALLKQKDVERIMSELRDFYDKDSAVHYRHGVTHRYDNIRSTMILCGTNVLRRSDNAFLGERFLDFELLVSDADREAIENKMLYRSMANALNNNSLPPETPVIAAAKGFIEHLMARENPIILGVREKDNILAYARLCACMRTKVDREKFGEKDMTFTPVVEVPARLIGQLTKLYICATHVLGLDKPNEQVHKLVQKITADIIDVTCPRIRICRIISDEFKSRDEIYEALGKNISEERVTTELTDLVALKLLEGKVAGAGTPGRNRYVFRLKPEISNQLSRI